MNSEAVYFYFNFFHLSFPVRRGPIPIEAEEPAITLYYFDVRNTTFPICFLMQFRKGFTVPLGKRLLFCSDLNAALDADPKGTKVTPQTINFGFPFRVAMTIAC